MFSVIWLLHDAHDAHDANITCFASILSSQGRLNMEKAGLMNRNQYLAAEHYLIGWRQQIQEKQNGHVTIADTPTETVPAQENYDDPCVRTHSTEHDRALKEFRVYCNICKKQRNRPRSYVGEIRCEKYSAK